MTNLEEQNTPQVETLTTIFTIIDNLLLNILILVPLVLVGTVLIVTIAAILEKVFNDR